MDYEIEKLFDEGVVLYEQGKLNEAEEKFLGALNLDSTSDEIKYNLALVYLEKKEYDKTNFLIAQIKEFDCIEIIDELEKVNFEVKEDNPFQSYGEKKSEQINQRINYYIDALNDEFLPEFINCEICESKIKLSEIERQNKYYTCPECKHKKNIRENERELKLEFNNKPDSELFEILIDSKNFRIEFVLAAKKEIKIRNINLLENEDFKSLLEGIL